MKATLSVLQTKMLEKLKSKKPVTWVGLQAGETKSLTSLVKRGLATVHNLGRNGEYTRETYWTLKK